MGFKIGKNFHVIHMTGDLRQLDLWYYDVFSVRRFMPESYMPAEKRHASLALLGDLCVEPLAPAFDVEGWDDMPLGRYYNRHGNRFHSMAWYVDEGMGELYDTLRAAGIECRGTAGVLLTGEYTDGPVFTNPRGTFTQLEFISAPNVPGGPAMLNDPRYLPGWSSAWWADYHPLQIQKISHLTISTSDLAQAKSVFVDVLQGKLLHEDTNPILASRSAYVQIGEDSVVELAEPAGEGPLLADMQRYHHSIYAVTFKVRDLADAKDFLLSKAVRFSVANDQYLVSDAETTQGAVMMFTTWDIPGDTRPGWSKHTDGPPPAQMFRSRPAAS